MTYEERRTMRALIRRVKAQEALLASYRVQRGPSERTFAELDATREAVSAAEVLLSGDAR